MENLIVRGQENIRHKRRSADITRQLFLIIAAASIALFSPLSAIAATPTSTIPVQYRSSGKTAPDGNLPVSSSFAAKSASPSPAIQANFPTPPPNQQPECPAVLMTKCHFVPAAYIQNDPNNKVDYGNYDFANRPNGGLVSQPGKKLEITSVVIHDTEGPLESAIATFKDPTSYVSAHYIIDKDGQIYQMVRTKDVAWHAGNWYTNIHSIGIEHVGHAVNGRVEYTPAMYASSALLTKYLAQRYNFPMDHAHILGHDNVQGPTQAFVAGMHYDPGPFWNWQMEFSIMGVPLPTIDLTSPLVTITKPFTMDNNSPVQDCSSGTCVALPNQPTNFVYLRTSPSSTAPLLSDAAIHPDGSPGTTRIEDWSATAVYGQQFAVAKKQGDWTAIWFGGKMGWFQNQGQVRNALPSRGQYVTPKLGVSSIPVYGRAYPESSAYNGTQVPVQSVVPLDYTIPAGQRYSTSGPVSADYYYAWAIDASLPDDHTVVVGNKVYLQIQYNHRIAYVDRDDIILK